MTPARAHHVEACVRENLAVVRFTIAGLYLAAINVCDDNDEDGDWYTTITDEASARLLARHRQGRNVLSQSPIQAAAVVVAPVISFQIAKRSAITCR
jgi:hypothetical protein